jgi:hypothetical protein
MSFGKSLALVTDTSDVLKFTADVVVKVDPNITRVTTTNFKAVGECTS